MTYKCNNLYVRYVHRLLQIKMRIYQLRNISSSNLVNNLSLPLSFLYNSENIHILLMDEEIIKDEILYISLLYMGV